MYSDLFCQVYNAFGWNYYPEVFGQQLLQWLERKNIRGVATMDLACGTGILCRMLQDNGMTASGMDYSSGMIDIARGENPGIPFYVADMITFCPEERYGLVTCTGDAVNHIRSLDDVKKIFTNVFTYLQPGGWFVFDLLDEKEVSTSEPFEMDWENDTRVWFQMTRPGLNQVQLTVRLYDKENMQFEENIRETIHDPEKIVELLQSCGFAQVQCSHRLLPDSERPATTWFVTAQKPQ